MKRAILLIGFLFWVHFLLGQEIVNPFEIRSRIDSVFQSPVDKEADIEANVFDIENRKGQTDQNDIVPIENNSIEESTIVPPVGEDQGVESIDEEKAVNPFDVSHIPVRKSKLKKEATAFKSKLSPKLKKQTSNAFIFWLILLTGLLLAIVINTQRGALTKIGKAITNENVLKLNHREEKKGINGHYFLLYVSFVINASIFLYLIQYNFLDLRGWNIFQKTLFAVLIIYIVRHLFLLLVSHSFPVEKEASLYSFTIQSFNLFIGIILIPMNLIIAFGPEKAATPVIYLVVIFIGLLFVLRNLRGILIGSKYFSGNLFHFLLYLCTFEILPILLLIKVIGNFGSA